MEQEAYGGIRDTYFPFQALPSCRHAEYSTLLLVWLHPWERGRIGMGPMAKDCNKQWRILGGVGGGRELQ